MQNSDYCRSQPWGTMKAYNNKETKLNIDLNHLFISAPNVALLLNQLYHTYSNNGGTMPIVEFKNSIIDMIYKWASERNLQEYTTVEINATGFNNYSEALIAINNDFKASCYNFFSWNIFNPFKALFEVGDSNCRVLKKGYQMNATDHQTLELWREQYIYVTNSKYRNNNAIPKYEIALTKRNYDRGSEGLRNGNGRSSLENIVRGYS